MLELKKEYSIYNMIKIASENNKTVVYLKDADKNFYLFYELLGAKILKTNIESKYLIN